MPTPGTIRESVPEEWAAAPASVGPPTSCAAHGAVTLDWGSSLGAFASRNAISAASSTTRLREECDLGKSETSTVRVAISQGLFATYVIKQRRGVRRLVPVPGRTGPVRN